MKNRVMQNNRNNRPGSLLIRMAIAMLALLLLAGFSFGEGQQGEFNRDAFRNLGAMYKENTETGYWICSGEATIPTGEEDKEINIRLILFGTLNGEFVKAPYLEVTVLQPQGLSKRDIGAQQLAVATDEHCYSWKNYYHNSEGNHINIYLGSEGYALIQELAEGRPVAVQVQAGIYPGGSIYTCQVDPLLLELEIMPLCQAILSSNCHEFLDFSSADEFENYADANVYSITGHMDHLLNSNDSTAKYFADQEGFSFDPFSVVWTYQKQFNQIVDGYQVSLSCELQGIRTDMQNCRIAAVVKDENGNDIKLSSLTITVDGKKYEVTFGGSSPYLPMERYGYELLRDLSSGNDISIRIRLEDATKISINPVDPERLIPVRDFSERVIASDIYSHTTRDTEKMMAADSYGNRITVE